MNKFFTVLVMSVVMLVFTAVNAECHPRQVRTHHDNDYSQVYVPSAPSARSVQRLLPREPRRYVSVQYYQNIRQCDDSRYYESRYINESPVYIEPNRPGVIRGESSYSYIDSEGRVIVVVGR